LWPRCSLRLLGRQNGGTSPGEAKAWKTLPYDLPRLIKAIALLADGGEVEAGPTKSEKRYVISSEVAQGVLDDNLLAVENATERVERLTNTLEEKILASSLAPLVRGLMVGR